MRTTNQLFHTLHRFFQLQDLLCLSSIDIVSLTVGALPPSPIPSLLASLSASLYTPPAALPCPPGLPGAPTAAVSATLSTSRAAFAAASFDAMLAPYMLLPAAAAAPPPAVAFTLRLCSALAAASLQLLPVRPTRSPPPLLPPPPTLYALLLLTEFVDARRGSVLGLGLKLPGPPNPRPWSMPLGRWISCTGGFLVMPAAVNAPLQSNKHGTHHENIAVAATVTGCFK
jgi:hypothetical protein